MAIFTDLVEEADAAIAAARDDFDGFLRCREQFDHIVHERLYLGMLNNFLIDNLAGKREVTPDISSGPFLVLHGSRHSTWAIITHKRPSRYLYLAPSHSISARITDSPVTVAVYAVPDAIELAIFDGETSLRLEHRFLPDRGQSIVKNGRKQVLDIAPSGNRMGITFRVNTLPFEAFEWSFERQTLRPNQVSSMRQFESNLTTIFDLLAAAGAPDSIGHIEPFVDHPTHFVRWKAIQTIGSIDENAAMPLVARAADDAHPDIRAAARHTLEMACEAGGS